MKILNLYAGIGGNRKLWPDCHNVTAVENNRGICSWYLSQFPQDTMIVEDAHEYLRQNYENFDFIWSSPPCPTHSRIRKYTNGGRFDDVYPDMRLWQEIIFLQHHFKGKWVVENTISYYEPFIDHKKIGRHYFWANFHLVDKNMPAEIRNTKHRHKPTDKQKYFPDYPRQLIRNAVHPKLGLHILNCAFVELQKVLVS